MIVFDVDGTLSESRSPMDAAMAVLFIELLNVKKVAIITGGAFADINKQILSQVNLTESQKSNLTLLPTNGGALWIYKGGWEEISSNKLTAEEKNIIVTTLKEVLDDGDDVCLPGDDCQGKKIQDRESQITYSARGDMASIETKVAWDPSFLKRSILEGELQKRLPQFEVKIGGKTSIDITPKGMDKAYGMRILLTNFNLKNEDILFIGDAVYEGGNDFPVWQMGIDTVKVAGPEKTREIIKSLLGQENQYP